MSAGEPCNTGSPAGEPVLQGSPADMPNHFHRVHRVKKARRAPLLLVAVACLGPREPNTPSLERMVSMGAAIQNLLLGAHAMGFGAGLTSGRQWLPRECTTCAVWRRGKRRCVASTSER